jgi:cell division protein FtsN
MGSLSLTPLEHFAFLMVALGLLMLTVLLAYFRTHREQELANLEVLETQRPSRGKHRLEEWSSSTPHGNRTTDRGE